MRESIDCRHDGFRPLHHHLCTILRIDSTMRHVDSLLKMTKYEFILHYITSKHFSCHILTYNFPSGEVNIWGAKISNDTVSSCRQSFPTDSIKRPQLQTNKHISMMLCRSSKPAADLLHFLRYESSPNARSGLQTPSSSDSLSATQRCL